MSAVGHDLSHDHGHEHGHAHHHDLNLKSAYFHVIADAATSVLAILAFAVVVWISEAVSYEASAIMITSLLAFLLGTAPTLADPSVVDTLIEGRLNR
mgnify:CR=1 FL=1